MRFEKGMDMRSEFWGKRAVFGLVWATWVLWGILTGWAETTWPGETWEMVQPRDVGMDAGLLEKARDFALTGQGSGFVVRHWKCVMKWGDQQQRYDLKSSTKAIGVTAVGLALADGKFAGLHDRARKYHPELGVQPGGNKDQWLDKITLFHLATQTAGFDKVGGYTNLLFEPGTQWSYSDGGPNWLAECVTLAYGRDVDELMFERVFAPIGIGRTDLTWRSNSYRDKKIAGVMRREFGSGISANVEAMARIGYLYLRKGRWKGQQIIPSWFVDAARVTPKEVRGLEVVRPESYFDASDHYGLLWWNNNDGQMKGVPRDAYWSWGLYDSLIVVIPSLDVVIARAGKSLNKGQNSAYSAIEPLIRPIAQSVAVGQGGWVPYPRSEVIRKVRWADPDTIVRKAKGSDNWPMTWADDDRLYTAYGDGWGFELKVEKKLSLGLCRVSGTGADFVGENIRSQTGEKVGQGSAGIKASGIMMVDGVLYMLVRNAENSQVAWSGDRGATWTWSDWRFEESFGAPTFLNFGKNYAGARDEYVYVYSHDSDSAYEAADRMVMARVRKGSIREKGAWEFFKGLDADGEPLWTKDVRDRGAVLVNPGRCYRNSVSYNAGVKRYLWCQTLYGPEDMRFSGGIAIFDAPEPWGPWTTVYYSEQWDVGPGESSCLPTKWMSPDGKKCYLVFSGEDCFSVREVEFE